MKKQVSHCVITSEVRHNKKSVRLLVNDWNKLNILDNGVPLKAYIETDKRQGPVRLKIQPTDNE